jgi:hypothetical protein
LPLSGDFSFAKEEAMNTVFRAASIKFLTLAILAVPLFSVSSTEDAFAGDGTACPVFTSEMIDAAAMAFGLSPGIAVQAAEDPTIPYVVCEMSYLPAGNSFVLSVNEADSHVAYVFGEHAVEDDRDYDTNLFSYSDELTPAEVRACRAVVLRSFVWKNFCAPALQ